MPVFSALTTLVEFTRRTQPRERTPGPLPRVAVLVLAMMFSLGIAALSMAGAAQDEQTTLPRLNSVLSHTVDDGTMVVSGANFTPGGEVFIAIRGAADEAPRTTAPEARWTTASEHTLAVNGSHDPNLGFHPGGAVYESFDYRCGQSVTVRAFDVRTAGWSTPLDLNVECGA